ncbi:hypothetical protein BN874_430008 [Candidatus Contendobacter odensis Run_B_J11]|uniref:Uncharacterized protein n=1 Tax=Candidatus Contendobacter odensis Run_B_J11 TaxID=1400861 RepID=A0A7U7J3N8_9GAMM|nr:hypothetical protein BN874_430008 [Candidatus Contendobacter odensis Run_B_J11]
MFRRKTIHIVGNMADMSQSPISGRGVSESSALNSYGSSILGHKALLAGGVFRRMKLTSGDKTVEMSQSPISGRGVSE